jgi:HEAT repeat protein
MTDIQNWLRLLQSPDLAIRHRAAAAILQRGEEAPLAVLLDILDGRHGAFGKSDLEKALLACRDPELVGELIQRLNSMEWHCSDRVAYLVYRSLVCSVLGRIGSRAAAPHLLKMLNDPSMLVRHAAAYALGDLKDPDSAPALLRCYEQARGEDINVREALEFALNSLGVEYEKHPWEEETAPCPYCGQPLRTSIAKQCRHCLMDWHDPG